MKISGVVIVVVFMFAWVGSSLGGGLLVDSNFNGSPNSMGLRTNSGGQDWYESRQDDENLLTLDYAAIGGNATAKAKLAGGSTRNAYLTQEFSSPQTQRFSAQWDIYVDSIYDRPDSTYDRAAWMFIGDDSVTNTTRPGPNAEDSERFVYLGFYKAGGGASGTMDLVARESTFVTVAAGLHLKQWYTIKVIVDVAMDRYDVYVDGQFKGRVNARTPKDSITYISFAEWPVSEGSATFYVDNVYADSDAGDTTFTSLPVNGALDTGQWILMMSWPTSPGTAYYHVFVSEDREAVAASDPAVRVAIKTMNTVTIGGLEPSQTYYWRVNRQSAGGTITPGEVWSFRTADYLVLDDFERYVVPGRDISDAWVPAGGVVSLWASQSIVYAGAASMALTYRNVVYPFAEATYTFDPPEYLPLYGGDALSLRVRGEAGNTPQTLYVELSDIVIKEGGSVVRSSRVEHPDRNIVTRTDWTEWVIPLSEFSEINVKAVAMMTIGVGNPPAPPEPMASSVPDPAGTIYVDCVRIVNLSGAYPPVGFWGHVWNQKSWDDTGAKVPAAPATVVFQASNDRYPNEHPSPGPGEYYVSVHGHPAYTVTVAAPGFRQEVFDLSILPPDATGRVNVQISPREGGRCDPFNSDVAGCGANGLDFYLEPLP